MGSLSIWHWLIVLAFFFGILWPIGKIIGRAGFSPFWALLTLVPLANIVGLWVFATVRWRLREVSN